MKILGFAQALDGETVCINTTTDEMVKVHIKNHRKRWGLYCNHVKITIEKLTKEEFDKELKLK